MDGLGTASGFDSPMDENGWLPIETAPKDGAAVLLFGRVSDHPEGLVSFNGDSRITGYWDAMDQAWCASASTWVGPFINASHWQPLPNPPALKEQGE